jgi:hypothetical protein
MFVNNENSFGENNLDYFKQHKDKAYVKFILKIIKNMFKKVNKKNKPYKKNYGYVMSEEYNYRKDINVWIILNHRGDKNKKFDPWEYELWLFSWREGHYKMEDTIINLSSKSINELKKEILE